MVPHLKVEEAIYAFIAESSCVVTGIPDEQRGERLVALYTRLDLEPAELWKRLSETELPRLWLPKREDIYQVESLPMLGTGKLDLRGVKEMVYRALRTSTSTGKSNVSPAVFTIK
jgi:acyl-[acyl-carrier-protein]-phospholipid O-acyltransferase/long-chain-fatty-acid--[acyl-carrier-protein] ligase